MSNIRTKKCPITIENLADGFYTDALGTTWAIVSQPLVVDGVSYIGGVVLESQEGDFQHWKYDSEVKEWVVLSLPAKFEVNLEAAYG